MSWQVPESVAALRRFAQPPVAVERCELCSVPLAPQHPHLVEPATRQLLCACDACALLFSERGETKYRRVPRRIRALSDFQLADAQWNALQIPIGLAFVVHSSAADQMLAIYPSPAGPTESLLDLEDWAELVQDNPVLRQMESDVESLLVNRIGTAREYYLAPIDHSYQLVGLLRRHWQGISGGTAVWDEIGNFFASLKKQSSRSDR